jgi:hypothetical protein
MFGVKSWSNSVTGGTSVVSPTFTAPTSETNLILIAYEASGNRTCNAPSGGALSTYTTVLLPVVFDTNPLDYKMCAFVGQGTNTNGAITESFSGSITVASIQVIEITGDVNATVSLANNNSGTSAAPSWLLSGAATTGTAEFLFGDLENGTTAPPSWNTIAGFGTVGTTTTYGTTDQFTPTVYFGTPSAATVNGTLTASGTWGTIGIEVSP